MNRVAERHPCIYINPQVNFGKPSVGKDHIKVSRIIECLSMYPEKRVLRDFPSLTHEDIEEAVLFAMDLLEESDALIVEEAAG